MTDADDTDAAETGAGGFDANAALLRVFVGDEDKVEGDPLYEVIAERALKAGLSGATVLPAPLGYGQSRSLRSEYTIDAGMRASVVVEIVDSMKKIEAFLPTLDALIGSGLVTIEKVRARYYPGAARGKDDADGPSL